MALMVQKIPLSQPVQSFEAQAVLHGIALSYHVGLNDFTVESDCSDICEKVSSQEFGRSLFYLNMLIKKLML